MKSEFKTNDSALFRIHKDDENVWQMVYQILGAYFEDDCADKLINDPVLTLTAIFGKKAVASQPTLSRFFNRMDDTTLLQFYGIMRKLRKVVYAIKRPQLILPALDSTLLDTYGHQEGEGFNFYYQNHGYHPLACYDGITGDLYFSQSIQMSRCYSGAIVVSQYRFSTNSVKQMVLHIPSA